MILAVLVALMPACENRQPELQVESREVTALDSILPLQQRIVMPVLYEGILDLQDLPVDEKKQKFYDIMLPAILVAKHNFEQKRERVYGLHMLISSGFTLRKKDQEYLNKLLKEFKAKDSEELLSKLQLPPTSIILAQAAVESGWGTSRFFREAHNVFGIWSYRSNEPRVKALESRDGKGIYVRKYKNLAASIEDYLRLLARAGAYKYFRELCQQQEDPFQMLPGLLYYSELREGYVDKLAVVMRVNDLTVFDEYALHPASFR
jgi:Bax protein